MKTTWKPGDRVRYYGTDMWEDIKPGLFFYSGFGMGKYFSKTGEVLWVETSEAQEQAHKEEVKFVFKDSFTYYSPTYLGD